MKHCQQCNLDFPGSYGFCGSCGAPLSDSRRCPGCGELAEGKWTFCTTCGRKFSSDETNAKVSLPDAPKPADIPAPPAVPSSTPSPSQTKTISLSQQQGKNVSLQEWYAAPDLFEEASETTATPIPRQGLVPKTTIAPPRATVHPQVGNGKAAPILTMLAAYGQSETAPPEWQWPRGALLGLLLLLFIGVLGAGGWYWWTHRASTAQSPAQADSATAPAAADSSSSPATSTATASSARVTTGGGAAEEWKRLREERISAKPSEASEIITSLEEAERKYPRDYRFPYERAKLSVKGITTHHEAFGALSLAGEKAIDDGKAQEMLDNLMADKDGDFYKLSRGHHEWQALVQALSNKDKRGLSELHH